MKVVYERDHDARKRAYCYDVSLIAFNLAANPRVLDCFSPEFAT